MRSLNRRTQLLASLALALVIGCGVGSRPTASTPASPTNPPATPTNPPPARPAAPTQTPDFPRTVVDDEGTSLTLASKPQNIISLTPANTELVFALGAGDRLRGGTDFDDYPPEAVALPDVATFSGVLIEKVLALQPDLVLAGGNNFNPPADLQRLRDLGVPILVVYAPSVDGVLADIELIGKAIGADQAAQAMVTGMTARIDEVTTALAGLDRQRVFYEIGNEPEIFGPAPDSFVADMVQLAGGDPITTTDPAVFSISLERLVSQDPQVIVLGDAAYGVCPDAVMGRAGWGSMTAVREGVIKPVDDTIVTRPGPRLAEGLAALALAIHPDATVAPAQGATDFCASPTPTLEPSTPVPTTP